MSGIGDPEDGVGGYSKHIQNHTLETSAHHLSQQKDILRERKPRPHTLNQWHTWVSEPESGQLLTHSWLI